MFKNKYGPTRALESFVVWLVQLYYDLLLKIV
jgi:hypothetical protein